MHRRRILLWLLLALVVFLASGALLADHLMPPATGAPSHALALQPDRTEIDRELAPMFAANPGKTGVLVVSDGLDAFAVRAISARRAGRSLDLMYYMWHDDLTGRLLAREAYAAAGRGVRVRLLLDDINTDGLDPQLLAMDAHPNVELRVYNAFRNRAGPTRLLEMLHRASSINHRMHNKAWIADGRVAVVGGRNIGMEYFSADPDVNFRDLDLLLFGPAVGEASAVFDAYWNSPAAVPIAALHPPTAQALADLLVGLDVAVADPAAAPYLARVAASRHVMDYEREALLPHWTANLSIVADPPLKFRGDDREQWLVRRLADAILATQGEALLISPYFVPGEEGTDALAGLVARGVDVGVITNSLAANDVPAVHGGYASYREDLLRRGVRLFEVKAQERPESAGRFGSHGASLHTKAFVLDGRRGFVGSFNLDPRSADLNTEMGVLFDDAAIAREVRREYARLAGPALSYRVILDQQQRLRWMDDAATPPRVLDHEPDTDAGQRLEARFFQALPIESQL